MGAYTIVCLNSFQGGEKVWWDGGGGIVRRMGRGHCIPAPVVRRGCGKAPHRDSALVGLPFSPVVLVVLLFPLVVSAQYTLPLLLCSNSGPILWCESANSQTFMPLSQCTAKQFICPAPISHPAGMCAGNIIPFRQLLVD